MWGVLRRKLFRLNISGMNEIHIFFSLVTIASSNNSQTKVENAVKFCIQAIWEVNFNDFIIL